MAIDPLAVQDRLIEVLNSNAVIQTTFLDSNGKFNQVLDDDPLAVSPTEQEKMAVVLVGEVEDDATLGASSSGTYKGTCVFAIMIYLFDDSRANGEGSTTKRKLVNDTVKVRVVLDQIRTDPQNSNGKSMWYLTKYRKPTTTYHYSDSFRVSITYIEVYSRGRFS